MNTVTNNSSYTVSAVMASGGTLTLPPGKSEEIDRWDTVKSFTATPARASLKAAGDDWEFYDTPQINLAIANLLSSTGNTVNLYTSGCTDNSSGVSTDPISFTSATETAHKIFATTPTLRATVTISGDEYPLHVAYEYNPAINIVRVTIGL
jgi:hypothetical protein